MNRAVGEPMLFFRNLSYRSKLFLAVVALVMLISAMLAFSAWAMVSPYLEGQIKERGAQLAQRLAWRTRTYILNRDSEHLAEIIFDEKYHEKFLSYILVMSDDGKVLAHTFLGPAASHLLQQHTPEEVLAHIASLSPEQTITLRQEVSEGLNRVGLIMLGIKKSHINRVINRLYIFNAVFIACLTAVGLVMAFYLSNYITRPILSLTSMADRVSQGDFSAAVKAASPTPHCWDLQGCEKLECPAHGLPHLRCWLIDGTKCGSGSDLACSDPFPYKLRRCRGCKVYRWLAGDETRRLYDAFAHMTHSLHRSQSELKVSEMKYRDLFDHSPLAIFVLDRRSMEILDANAWAQDQYGYSLEHLRGMRFMDLLEPEQVERVAEVIGGRNGGGRLRMIDKLRQRRANGELFYATLLASLPRDSEPGTLIVTCSDVTLIVEAESKTIQAAKMATLGEMSAGVAHELNQPLNAIRVGSDYLHLMVERGEVPRPAELAEVDEVIREQVERAAAIIRHLRDFGRQSKVETDKVDINRPIQGVFSLVGQQLRLRGLEVILDLAEDLPPVWGDPIRLEQVFMNLVVNARDALLERPEAAPGGEAGVISVTSRLENGLVMVRVRDNGPGIEEGARQKVFQPFFTTKPVGKGTGLGLSISYSIVREHRGQISLRCPPEGGTVFTLTFPPVR